VNNCVNASSPQQRSGGAEEFKLRLWLGLAYSVEQGGCVGIARRLAGDDHYSICFHGAHDSREAGAVGRSRENFGFTPCLLLLPTADYLFRVSIAAL
jgi:hypothetical protein